jgi:predicted signal transduction protein with EAL and GGDEF domain
MAVSEGASAASLIARADQALYEAKQAGKNRLVEWKPPDQNDTATPTTKPRNPRYPQIL